jgi:rhodanese-related sulfurtransferase
MAIGAALALRGGDRLPVAVLGDGDYLMGLTALWTGVHYRIPVLIIIANNQSFFNDELHQERTARVRGRPVENRWIGIRMSDPEHGSRGTRARPGCQGLRSRAHRRRFEAALAQGVADVRAGAVAVIDVRVAAEYSRTVSSALMRHIPAGSDEAQHARLGGAFRQTLVCRGSAASITAAAGTSRRVDARSPVMAPATQESLGRDGRRHGGRRRSHGHGGRERRFPRWRDTPAQERAKAIRAAAAILLQRADELAWLEALDTGNPFQAMRFDVEISVAYMEYFAGLVTEIKGSTIPIGRRYAQLHAARAAGRGRPHSAPSTIRCSSPRASAALRSFAGNTLVVKPADQTPLSSLRIAELWHDIFPPACSTS